MRQGAWTCWSRSALGESPLLLDSVLGFLEKKGIRSGVSLEATHWRPNLAQVRPPCWLVGWLILVVVSGPGEVERRPVPEAPGDIRREESAQDPKSLRQQAARVQSGHEHRHVEAFDWNGAGSDRAPLPTGDPRLARAQQVSVSYPGRLLRRAPQESPLPSLAVIEESLGAHRPPNFASGVGAPDSRELKWMCVLSRPVLGELRGGHLHPDDVRPSGSSPRHRRTNDRTAQGQIW